MEERDGEGKGEIREREKKKKQKKKKKKKKKKKGTGRSWVSVGQYFDVVNYHSIIIRLWTLLIIFLKCWQLILSAHWLHVDHLDLSRCLCCTKVCNLHLDDSFSKSRDNRMHWTRCNLLKWKGIYKNYEPFTDQLQPIYFTCNGL